MSTYKISEAARTTGFSVSALRFYEQEGMVVPERASSGYREYRTEDIGSLRFVARGKQLGLSLDQIKELLVLVEEDDCAPVQSRIRELVNERIGQAHDRIAELVGFTAQLQEAAARLGVHTPDGACDDDCGCRSDPGPSNQRERHDQIPLAGSSSGDIACSLHPGKVSDRVDDWTDALDAGRQRENIDGGIRIRFEPPVDIARLAELAAAEQSCCSFFEFRITISQGLVALDVTGPDDAQPVIASVFGVAA